MTLTSALTDRLKEPRLVAAGGFIDGKWNTVSLTNMRQTFMVARGPGEAQPFSACGTQAPLGSGKGS